MWYTVWYTKSVQGEKSASKTATYLLSHMEGGRGGQGARLGDGWFGPGVENWYRKVGYG